VAADADGNFVVAWVSEGQDGSGDGIYAQRFSDARIAQGPEFRVNTYTTGDQRAPAVAMDADGGFVVVWESEWQDGSSLGIYAQRYHATGSANGPEFRVNTYTNSYQLTSAVAMRHTGEFIVTWTTWFHTTGGDVTEIHAQRYDDAGVPQGGEFRVNTDTLGTQHQSTVGVDASGAFVVAWQSADGDSFGIRAQRYAADGTASGGEFQVNTYTTGNQALPKVGMSSSGHFLVVWYSSLQDGSSEGVFAQMFDSSGGQQGAEFRVNTYTTASQVYPAVAVDSGGDYLVVWESLNQDGSHTGIFAQRYSQSGAPVGGEYQVNATTADGQYQPSVAAGGTDGFVISWFDSIHDGDLTGVFINGPAAPLPPEYAPAWTGVASSSLGGAAAGAGGGGPAVSSGGVRYADGAVAAAETDLWSGGYGVGWGHARSWTNRPGYAQRNVNGNGVVNPHQPFLVRKPGGATLAVVRDGTRADYFDLAGGVWAERLFGQDKLVYDAANTQYVLTDTRGGVSRFHDFSPSLPDAQRGALKGYADPAGNPVALTYTAAGLVNEVTRVAGGVTESLLYAYLSLGDPNPGLLESVTLRRRVGAGGWVPVRSATYAYYGAAEDHGNLGDLKTATVRAGDPTGPALNTSYYRYYKPGDAGGYAGGLKAAFGGSAYARLVYDHGANPGAHPDALLAPYADRAFTYDAHRRVATETTAGRGAVGFAYTASANPAGTNSWAVKTVETLPGGDTATVYTNAYGQAMLSEARTAGTGLVWRSYSRFDAQGRVVLAAAPSAVTGATEATPDLVNFVGGNAQFLSDAAGLVTAYTYAGTTTATDTAAGDAAGYWKQTDLRRGELGAAVPQAAQTYIRRTAGGVGFFFPAAGTAYRNADGTGGQTTTTAYTWQGSTARPASVTVTLPAVTAAQNGPGTATAGTTVFDAWGRPAWAKDAGGFLHYTEYDPATGAVTKTIADVNTLGSGFTGLPAGWVTPPGGGKHLTAVYEVDALGRTTKATSPAGRVAFTVYNDPAHEARTYPGWVADTPDRPPTVLVRDDRGRGYAETLTMSAAPALDGSGRPTGGEAVAGLRSVSRAYRDKAGRVVSADDYFDLAGLTYTAGIALGVEGTNFHRSVAGYDARGRADRAVTPQGTVTRIVYDGLGRPVSTWVGTDDAPDSGSWSPSNTAGTNLVKVGESEYNDGGAGDGLLTKATAFPGLGAPARVTRAWYDWRGRPVLTKAGVETTESTSVNRPITYLDYDNLGAVTKTRRYDGDAVAVADANADGVPDAPAASLLRAQSAASYDELGRVYRSEVFSVSPTNGAVGGSLKTDAWYDARGYAVKTLAPGGVVTKTAYDGVGRVTVAYTADGGGDAGYADALTVAGDTVLDQAAYVYDPDGNVKEVETRARFHDTAGTGPLGTPTTGPKARVSYAGYYYDAAGRVTAAVDIGTSPGTVWAWPSTPPTRSDTVLVDSWTYGRDGRVEDATDPRGVVTRTTFDALGRTAETVENYVDGVVSDVDDKTTGYAYNGAGPTAMTFHLTGGGVQTTGWEYGVTAAGGSGVESNDLVRATRWPDPATGAASPAQEDLVTVNALGQVATATDRTGTTHAYTYDVLGRVTADAVTALGAGVDGAVRRIATAYDGQGNPSLVTGYTAASGGSVVNQVKRDFNGLGQLTADTQSHAGAVGPSTPKVQYAYSAMPGGANHSRPAYVNYPSGYVLTSDYGPPGGLDDRISRLASRSEQSAVVDTYAYLGLGAVVRRSHPQPGVDLTYLKQGSEGDGEAGDQYAGLDRFGRVADQRWVTTAAGGETDRFGYGYDRGSNRVARDNPLNPAFDEDYTPDGLGRLASFARGPAGSPTRTLGWDYDAAGNWDGVTTNGVSVGRTANRQNELTAIAGAVVPAYDPAGRMTGDETGKQLVYDAWGRLVAVKDPPGAGGATLASYKYDGTGRRITETVGSVTTDLYYSAGWQVLEERVGGATAARYVWSPVYPDALVLRDRDPGAAGMAAAMAEASAAEEVVAGDEPAEEVAVEEEVPAGEWAEVELTADGLVVEAPGGEAALLAAALPERLWAQQDANWNVTALVDTAGVPVERYAYDPFGAVSVLNPDWTPDADGSDYGWQYLFQGLRRSAESGLSDARNRWYSSTLGRWITSDPIGYAAGDPNLYGFLGNRPNDATDPSGLDKWYYDPQDPNANSNVRRAPRTPATPRGPTKPVGVPLPGKSVVDLLKKPRPIPSPLEVFKFTITAWDYLPTPVYPVPRTMDGRPLPGLQAQLRAEFASPQPLPPTAVDTDSKVCDECERLWGIGRGMSPIPTFAPDTPIEIHTGLRPRGFRWDEELDPIRRGNPFRRNGFAIFPRIESMTFRSDGVPGRLPPIDVRAPGGPSDPDPLARRFRDAAGADVAGHVINKDLFGGPGTIYPFPNIVPLSDEGNARQRPVDADVARVFGSSPSACARYTYSYGLYSDPPYWPSRLQVEYIYRTPGGQWVGPMPARPQGGTVTNPR
jgi:RHS repeat-associated protein